MAPNETKNLSWKDAWWYLLQGKHIKRPLWEGYWAWEQNTIMMHCRDEGCDEYREEDDQYYVLEGWYEYIHNWGDYSSVRITEDKVVAWCEQPTPWGGEKP